MIYICITILVFSISCLIHIFLCRKVGFTVWSFGVYPLMLMLNTAVTFFLPKVSNGQVNWWTIECPVSSFFLFLLLCGVYFIFLTSVFLADESPATKIISQIKKHGWLTRGQIQGYFSDSVLISKRILELRRIGWINERRGLYRLLPKGIFIMRFISLYRNILAWERGG